MKMMTIQQKSIFNTIMDIVNAHSKIDNNLERVDVYIAPQKLIKNEWTERGWESRKLLFQTYNERNDKKYKNFFWTFTSIRLAGNTDMDISNPDIVNDAMGKIGLYEKYTDLNEYGVIELDVPDDIVLETDFYNYTDTMFDMNQFPFDDTVFIVSGERDRQAIIPYIKPEWVKAGRILSEFYFMNRK